MADSPRRSYSSSPAPKGHSRSKSWSRSRSKGPRSHSLSRSPPCRRSRSRSRSRSRCRMDAANPHNTLYVTGFSSRVTDRELEDDFSKEGKVAECRLIVEPRTRIS
ncbi:serine/arginine-rich splicing factor SR45a isoform X2 [Iris pallida]|uniref:Serine/arginine-rich splicing factor SR45a isoform X2 n=1 Tax=Iris pallida TaxID=29817 RepID=A0AAX6HFA5_IRIPA|nr:serine/arginine-rich splicing factor SR45a isoform X2 [Iris pallida]